MKTSSQPDGTSCSRQFPVVKQLNHFSLVCYRKYMKKTTVFTCQREGLEDEVTPCACPEVVRASGDTERRSRGGTGLQRPPPLLLSCTRRREFVWARSLDSRSYSAKRTPDHTSIPPWPRHHRYPRIPLLPPTAGVYNRTRTRAASTRCRCNAPLASPTSYLYYVQRVRSRCPFLQADK